MTLVASLFIFDNEALCNGEHELARPLLPSQVSRSIAPDLSVVFIRTGNRESRGTFWYASVLPSVNCDIIWFYMEFIPIKYQRIYEVGANSMIDEIKMVDKLNLKTTITTSTRSAEERLI